jgi:hypothetical protein
MPKPTVLPLWFGGQTGISNALDISTVANVVGIIMPTDWTPAIVTIEGSANGTDFYPIYDGMAATDLRFNVGPGTMVAINPNRLRCCMAIRLRSGSHDKPPIPQGVPREFGIIVESAAP